MTTITLPRSTFLALAELAEAQRDLAFALLLPQAPDHEAFKMKASGSLIGMERAIARARKELGLSGHTTMATALLTIVKGVRSYLPPDGIGPQALITLVIEATDNPAINPVIKELEA